MIALETDLGDSHLRRRCGSWCRCWCRRRAGVAAGVKLLPGLARVWRRVLDRSVCIAKPTASYAPVTGTAVAIEVWSANAFRKTVAPRVIPIVSATGETRVVLIVLEYIMDCVCVVIFVVDRKAVVGVNLSRIPVGVAFSVAVAQQPDILSCEVAFGESSIRRRVVVKTRAVEIGRASCRERV